MNRKYWHLKMKTGKHQNSVRVLQNMKLKMVDSKSSTAVIYKTVMIVLQPTNFFTTCQMTPHMTALWLTIIENILEAYPQTLASSHLIIRSNNFTTQHKSRFIFPQIMELRYKNTNSNGKIWIFVNLSRVLSIVFLFFLYTVHHFDPSVWHSLVSIC